MGSDDIKIVLHDQTFDGPKLVKVFNGQQIEANDNCIASVSVSEGIV